MLFDTPSFLSVECELDVLAQVQAEAAIICDGIWRVRRNARRGSTLPDISELAVGDYFKAV